MQQASDPKLLAKLARLELRARRAVEGLTGGRHLSPIQGSGSTFAEHREYVPGDEPRHLDWRLLARTDRPFVRRYQEENALTACLIVDSSASMKFTSLEWSKWDYATWLAASLARLLTLQHDSFALALGQGQELPWVPPGSGEVHWQRLVWALEQATPSGETEPAALLEEAAGRMERRGLFVWITDALGEVSAATQAAAHVRHAGHDLIVLRVLDPAEVSFPWGRATRFDPLESGEFLRLDPRAVRQAYLEEFETHGAALRRGLRGLNAEFRRMQTDEPLEAGLVEFLNRRNHRMRRVGR